MFGTKVSLYCWKYDIITGIDKFQALYSPLANTLSSYLSTSILWLKMMLNYKFLLKTTFHLHRISLVE